MVEVMPYVVKHGRTNDGKVASWNRMSRLVAYVSEKMPVVLFCLRTTAEDTVLQIGGSSTTI